MELAERKSKFDRLGTKVFGIAVADRDALADLQDTLGDNLTLLADPEGKAADAFGVVDTDPLLFGRKLAQSATFYVDKKGRIRYRWLPKSYRTRPNPDDVLKRIDELR